MRFIQLFSSLSCASAAVLPVLRRYSSVKFNQLMNQNGFENLPEQNLHLSPSLMPAKLEFPDLAPLGRVLPISFCEVPKSDPFEKRPMNPAAKKALKERLLAHNKLYPVPEPLGDYDPTKNPRFNSKGYERLLKEEKYYTDAAKAVIHDAIDLAYIPSDPKLLFNFSKHTAGNAWEIVYMKYFEAGTFEKMRQAGLATPNDFIEMLKDLIARYKNYYIANLVFDHIVAAMLNDIDSDDFNVADWELNREFLNYRSMDYDPPFSSIITFGWIPLSEEYKQYVKFYSRYNVIFVDSPVKTWRF